MRAAGANTLLRRQLLVVAGLLPAAAAATSPRAEAAVLALQRRRQAILARLARVHDQDERGLLCEDLDTLALAIAHEPTPTLAVARLKLLIVAEDYVAPHMSNGADLLLFNQVLGWMAAGEGAS